MKILLSCLVVLIMAGCASGPKLSWPKGEGGLTGTEFYKQAAAMGWSERDSLAMDAFFDGNVPGFLKKFVAIRVEVIDSVTGERFEAEYYVAPDYFSVGNDKDWARVPLTPMAAQRIADSLGCFLPTRKMVDDIYHHARVKLEPVPMYAYRDSTPTMWHHHLIIEGQRKGESGLIAGIKKDVVLSVKVGEDKRPDRVAIYGWHKLDGKPIQPLYTGHVNWYVDYSHGVRFVYRKIKVGRKWMDYMEVMKDERLRGILCDEGDCGVGRY